MKTERKALFITIFMIITPIIGYFIFGKDAVAYCISTYVLIFLSIMLYNLLCILFNNSKQKT